MEAFRSLEIRERKKHKHKQICGIVLALVGDKNLFYVFSWDHFLWGKHINKIPSPPPRIPYNPVKIMFVCVCVCVFFVVFWFPTKTSLGVLCLGLLPSFTRQRVDEIFLEGFRPFRHAMFLYQLPCRPKIQKKHFLFHHLSHPEIFLREMNWVILLHFIRAHA